MAGGAPDTDFPGMSDLEVAARAAEESLRHMEMLSKGEALEGEGDSSEEEEEETSSSDDEEESDSSGEEGSSDEEVGEGAREMSATETAVITPGPAGSALEATSAEAKPEDGLPIDATVTAAVSAELKAECLPDVAAVLKTEADSGGESSDSESSMSSGDGPVGGPEKLKQILDGGDSDDEVNAEGVFSKNEMKELPPPEPLEITLADSDEVAPCGKVSAMLEGQIVVQAPLDSRALAEGSVLVLPDRTPVGRIEEVFGPVQQPFYIFRYAGKETKQPATLKVGAEICSVVGHSTFVVQEQLYVKGYDNSGRDDEETEAVDFSDDEQEAEYKKGLKQKKRKGGRGVGGRANDLDVAQAAIDGDGGGGGGSAQKQQQRPPARRQHNKAGGRGGGGRGGAGAHSGGHQMEQGGGGHQQGQMNGGHHQGQMGGGYGGAFPGAPYGMMMPPQMGGVPPYMMAQQQMMMAQQQQQQQQQMGFPPSAFQMGMGGMGMASPGYGMYMPQAMGMMPSGNMMMPPPQQQQQPPDGIGYGNQEQAGGIYPQQQHPYNQQKYNQHPR